MGHILSKSQFSKIVVLFLMTANIVQADICLPCKNINKKVQDIQLEQEAGKQYEMMVDFIDELKKVSVPVKKEHKKRFYQALFAASFKLEEVDMDLDIAVVLAGLYKKNKVEFKTHLKTLPKAQQKIVVQKMEFVKVYIDFGEGPTLDKLQREQNKTEATTKN